MKNKETEHGKTNKMGGRLRGLYDTGNVHRAVLQTQGGKKNECLKENKRWEMKEVGLSE